MDEREVKRLAVFAGNGRLPRIALNNAARLGFDVLVIALTDQAKELTADSGFPTERVSLGKVGFCMRLLKNWGADSVLFIGKVEKSALLKGISLDWLAIKELVKLKERSDRAIMTRIVEILEERGLAVLPQTRFLQGMVAEVGVLGKVKVNRRIMRDFELAFPLAKRMADEGVGQTVVVKGGAVVAVEAMEGTDVAIRRGGELAGGDVVVVKVAGDDYDPRFDLPTVGCETLRTLAESGGGALGVEAGVTILVEREEMLAFADEHKMPLVGLDWGYGGIPRKPQVRDKER